MQKNRTRVISRKAMVRQHMNGEGGLFATVASLLEKRIGLAVEAMGSELIARIVRRHMIKSGLVDEIEYIDLLRKSSELWQSLVEAVVVPETWFLRNRESFSFLSRFAQLEWPERRKNEMLHILSVPCATGEEPYSIAMTLMEAAVPTERFHIEAMDISNPLLERAKLGIYGPESFRGVDLAFRERYFDISPDGFRIRHAVKDTVRFLKGNLLDGLVSSRGKPYDVIFCRNLLIYLTSSAKRQIVGLLDRLLAKEGIIFVGHSEHEIFNELGFEKIRQPKVFACRRTGRPRQARTRTRARDTNCEAPMAPPQRNCGPPPAGAVLPPPTRCRTIPRESSGSDPNMAPPQWIGTIPHAADSSAAEGVPLLKSTAPGADLKTSPDPKTSSSRKEESLFNSARRLADQGLLQDAFGLCDELLRENALHVQGHFLMALIRLALNDNKGAADSFNKAAYLDPNNYEALDYLALIAEQDGDWSGAVHLRQRAQRIRTRENKY